MRAAGGEAKAPNAGLRHSGVEARGGTEAKGPRKKKDIQVDVTALSLVSCLSLLASLIRILLYSVGKHLW
jgi:hypothetical protein